MSDFSLSLTLLKERLDESLLKEEDRERLDFLEDFLWLFFD